MRGPAEPARNEAFGSDGGKPTTRTYDCGSVCYGACGREGAVAAARHTRTHTYRGEHTLVPHTRVTKMFSKRGTHEPQLCRNEASTGGKEGAQAGERRGERPLENHLVVGLTPLLALPPSLPDFALIQGCLLTSSTVAREEGSGCRHRRMRSRKGGERASPRCEHERLEPKQCSHASAVGWGRG